MINEIPYENAFIIMKDKATKGIVIWTLLSVILMIVAIIFLLEYSFYPEEQIYGYVKQVNQEYRVYLYVKREEMNDFTNYQLWIDEEPISFQVEQIGQAIKIDDDIYYEVLLGMEMKKQWEIENNILSILVKKPKTTWFQKLKKGMKL